MFTQEFEGEKIIKVIHRHWFNLFIQFISVILASVAVFGSWIFILSFYPEIFDNVGGTATIHFIETTALIFIWFYAFLIWIDYYFDIWIITESRIINIEQRGLFIREASDMYFEKIQDATAEVTGLIPTILNYGNVEVQTAGEKERFEFHQIPDPYAVKALIMERCKGKK